MPLIYLEGFHESNPEIPNATINVDDEFGLGDINFTAYFSPKKLIDFGGVYRITKSSDPATLAGGGIGVGARTIPGTGNLRVFPLSFIAAPDMAGAAAGVPAGAVAAGAAPPA